MRVVSPFPSCHTEGNARVYPYGIAVKQVDSLAAKRLVMTGFWCGSEYGYIGGKDS